MTNTEPTTNFHDQRIAGVMGEVTKIGRDSKNNHAGYGYASADAVYDAVRPILAKHGVNVEHRVKGLKVFAVRETDFLCVKVWVRLRSQSGFDFYWSKYEIPVNIQSKAGVRFDAQGVQAAVTYAIKYFLRSRLLLNTGEPDADANAPGEAPARANRARAAAPKTPAPKAAPVFQVTADQLGTQAFRDYLKDGGTAAAKETYRFILRNRKDPKAREAITANLVVISEALPPAGQAGLGQIVAGWEAAANPPAIVEKYQKTFGGEVTDAKVDPPKED